MKVLDVREATDLLRHEVESLEHIRASEAVGIWRVTLWILSRLYPNYAICRPDPPENLEGGHE